MVLRQHVGTQSRSKEYFRMGFCVRAIGLAMAGMTVMTGMTWAQEQEDKAVLLVRMFYEAEQWSAKPLRILPCEAPSKPAPHTDRRSVLVLRGDDGKVLARRLITNPRIILIEDPKEQAKLLSQMEFTIAVP